MSSLSTRFIRQLKSEMTMVRTDRAGHTVLLVGLVVSVMWGVFLAYLTIVYQDEATTPSPRVPAGGLAQLGYCALMVWAVILLLGSKAKGFWNMRVLVEPARWIVSLATLVHLTVWSAVFAVLAVLVSMPVGAAVVGVMGYDSSSLLGSFGEVLTVLVQMVGFALGVTWFAAGWALICNSIGNALAVVLVWPFLLEGMLPDEGIAATLREFMPFINGLAWYQGNEALQLPWPAPIGLVYFLVITLAFALVGVWVRRHETLLLNS
ncbi:MAG: hypothetical protein Q4C74_08995 [Rothia sp. (in: high G+C Gram-positive bacteria)]|nr:hypothetical protein [Rothia sp. (in: high G+C Gram-positive bacteria)]